MISLEALRLHNTFAPANACVELTGIVTHRSSQISIPKQADVVVSLNTIKSLIPKSIPVSLYVSGNNTFHLVLVIPLH